MDFKTFIKRGMIIEILVVLGLVLLTYLLAGCAGPKPAYMPDSMTVSWGHARSLEGSPNPYDYAGVSFTWDLWPEDD